MNRLQKLANKFKIKIAHDNEYVTEDDYGNDEFYNALNRYEDDYLYDASYEELYSELEKLKEKGKEFQADDEDVPAFLKAKILLVKDLMEKSKNPKLKSNITNNLYNW